MLQPIQRVLQGGFKSLTIKGFEQVVHGMHFKSPQRKFVVRGHEHDDRHRIGTDRLENFKAVQLRHLDVEKDQVRFLLLNRPNGLASVRAFTHQLNLRPVRQQLPEPAAPELLVIDNDRARFHDDWAGLPRKGMLISTRTPPSSAEASSNRWASP